MSELATLTKTIEQIASLFEQHKATLNTRGLEIKKLGKASADTESKLAKFSADFDKLGDIKVGAEKAIKDSLEMKSRLDKIETVIRRGGGASLKASDVSPEAMEFKKAMNSYLRRCDVRGLESLIEKKALSVGNDPSGGYLVTPDMSGRIVKRVFETSPMRTLASSLTISTDALEGLNDTQDITAGWTSELGARINTTDPQFGKYRIPAQENYAIIPISQKLLEDASIDIEAYTSDKAGNRLARLENTAFVNGDGNGKPRGFLSYASGTGWGQIERTVSGNATTLTADGLLSLVYTLQEGYRAGATFVMSRSTQAVVRKLKDLQGRYLWEPGLVLGQPSQLMGYPLTEFQDMVAPAAGTLSVGFGNFKEAYQIVDRTNMSVIRDPFTSKKLGLVEFMFRNRVGGDIINFDAIKLQVTSL